MAILRLNQSFLFFNFLVVIFAYYPCLIHRCQYECNLFVEKGLCAQLQVRIQPHSVNPLLVNTFVFQVTGLQPVWRKYNFRTPASRV